MILKNFSAAAAALLFSVSAYAGSYDEAISAAVTNDADALAPLLEKGFDPNTTTTGGTGEPLLMLAIRNQSGNVVDLLLKQKNLKVDQSNALNETPLMIAVFLKDNPLAKKLIARGANVNNPRHWSPLHYAASAGNKDMVAYLISKGADVNARTLRGFTPLYMAARDADAKTVQMLLQAGARKDFCTNDELAPYDIAKQRRGLDSNADSKEVLKLLEYDHCR